MALITGIAIVHTTGMPVAYSFELGLDMDGFAHQKWGTAQRCKPGDWIVNNDGDHYTVNKESFAKTYRKVDPGIYHKSAPIWAEVATQSGEVETKEGVSHYNAGDYIVSNNEDGTDAYCISSAKFESMYELDE